jgi:adenylate kinase
MRLIFLGPPGAGKGTQAKIISQELKITHISTGDILRSVLKENSPLAEKVRDFVEKGGLVPDEIVCKIVIRRIREADCAKGFILDGFPRTQPQAEKLDAALAAKQQKIDWVIYFKTSDELCIKRLTGRRVCQNCQAIFHEVNIPPKKAGVCDYCSGPLIQRPDDQEETVRKRLKIYKEKTRPLLEYYEKRGSLYTADGNQDALKLKEDLLALFAKTKPSTLGK